MANGVYILHILQHVLSTFLLKHFVFSLTLLVKTTITSPQSSVLNINSIRNEGWNYVRNILALLNLLLSP